jgi:hypothetical protein
MNVSYTSVAVLALVFLASIASVVRWPGSRLPDSPLSRGSTGAGDSRLVQCPWPSLPWSIRTGLFSGLQDESSPVCGFELELAGDERRTLDIGGGETAVLELTPAAPLQFPRLVDSNSPAFWSGDQLIVFNSLAWPARTAGKDPQSLLETSDVDLIDPLTEGGYWLESVWKDESDGVLYGWYHQEPANVGCLTAPFIGAALSFDDGLTWVDMGPLLQSGANVDCSFDNGYFTGGHGDFSVILDQESEYFYFLFTDYGADQQDQGVSVARSAFADRGQPGTVYKYYEGEWSEPGIGGRSTPVLARGTGWQGPFVDEFWGPSVHWNTFLNRYVVLLNRTQGFGWDQEGVYIAFSRDLLAWTEPEKIVNSTAWYPQVLGLSPGETDTIAGAEARLFVGGISVFVVRFLN